MMPLMQEGQPPAWTSYVSVDDAAAVAAAVKEAGGGVIAEPMDVVGLGTMAIFSDPEGAVFGVWQPGTFAGAALVNEHGAIAWNELNTRDIGGAKEFYGAAFGWTFEDMESDEGPYSMIKLGDACRRHARPRLARRAGEMPTHWQVYFGVDEPRCGDRGGQAA